MKKSLLILLLYISGCQTYYINDNYLNGEWTDYKRNPNVLNLGGNEITIGFDSDNFYYWNKRWSDFWEGVTCPTYSGDEFASGKYVIKNDYIYLNGYWKSDGTYQNIKNTGCYNNGSFKIFYRYNIIDHKSIEFILQDSSYLKKYPTGIKPKFTLYKK